MTPAYHCAYSTAFRGITLATSLTPHPPAAPTEDCQLGLVSTTDCKSKTIAEPEEINSMTPRVGLCAVCGGGASGCKLNAETITFNQQRDLTLSLSLL